MRLPGEELRSIFAKYPVFEPAERSEKWQCTLTHHELAPKDLEAYVETKKFKREFAIHQLMEKFGEHFEQIGSNLMGCKLTNKKVARNPNDLERHIRGWRFQQALNVSKERKGALELVEAMEEEFGEGGANSTQNGEDVEMAGVGELIDETPLPNMDEAMASDPARRQKKKKRNAATTDAEGCSRKQRRQR